MASIPVAGTAERIRAGDIEAFEAFFHAEYGPLCSFLRRQVELDAVAEELAQDVLLRLWQARSRLRADAPLRAYLYRSARNAAINHAKRTARERRWVPIVEPPAGEPPTDDAARTNELAAAADAAIATLPERCRLIFELSRQRHLTHAEIAEALELSRKTVEAQIGRALRLLRSKLMHLLD